MRNKLRKALLERAPALGAWIQIGHPACAEIFGRLGFDWIAVDLEHGAIGLETMTDLFRAMAAFDAVPVVRLPVNDPVWIKRSLDAGARGLIVPMVNSAAEADAAVRAAKYPPRGDRGYGYCRANAHGADFLASLGNVNEEIAVVMQIEHRDGIGNLESILEVDGVDGVFIGPMDLSGSYGKTGELEAPEVREALARYREVCRRYRKAAGMHLVRPTPESVRKTFEDGYTMVALGLDNVFLAAAAEAALGAARDVIAGQVAV